MMKPSCGYGCLGLNPVHGICQTSEKKIVEYKGDD